MSTGYYWYGIYTNRYDQSTRSVWWLETTGMSAQRGGMRSVQTGMVSLFESEMA